MTTLTLGRKLYHVIQKYNGTLAFTLILITLGVLLAQFTPLVMEYSVNAVQRMLDEPVSQRRVLTIVGTRRHHAR